MNLLWQVITCTLLSLNLLLWLSLTLNASHRHVRRQSASELLLLVPLIKRALLVEHIDHRGILKRWLRLLLLVIYRQFLHFSLYHLLIIQSCLFC